MNKKTKLLIIFINLILCIFIASNTVQGKALVEQFESSITVGGSGAEDLKKEGGKIVGIIQVIGTIASVAMITILGIKYALGSAEDKAGYKKSMIPYLVGAVLIFGFSNITQWIYIWASEI